MMRHPIHDDDVEGTAQPTPFARAWKVFVAASVCCIILLSGYVGWHEYRIRDAVNRILVYSPSATVDLLPWQMADQDVLKWAADDLDLFVPRLMAVIESSNNDSHRTNALKALDTLLARSEHVKRAEKLLPRLINDLLRRPSSEPFELSVGHFARRCAGNGMVDKTTRANIMRLASKSSPGTRPNWIDVLSEIGGRDEVLLVLKLGDSTDPKILEAAVRSDVVLKSRWPGVAPFVIKKLDALPFLDVRTHCVYLWLTDVGRRRLFDLAKDSRITLRHRQDVMESILNTDDGVRLVRGQLQDIATRAALVELLGSNPELELDRCREKWQGHLHDEFWRDLISGLEEPNLDHYLRFVPESRKATERDLLKQVFQEMRKANLRMLRKLSGKDFTTSEEWSRWFRETRPGRVSLLNLLEIIEKTPELESSTAIINRIIPYRLGEIPDECLPVYRRLAKHGPKPYRVFAASSLLLLTDDLSAVPSLFDLLREEGAQRPEGGNYTLEILKRRFAQNFYWDVDAWENWWRTQTEFERPSEINE